MIMVQQKYINGGNERWHYQTFQDGTKRRRQVQHAEQHVVLATSQKRSRQHAEQLVEQVTNQKRSQQHVEQLAVHLTSNEMKQLV